MAVTWSPIFDWDTAKWRDDAACRHTNVELYFPAGNTGAAVDQIEAAKAVCRSCPVQRACLQFALESNQEAGIWGGKDEDERRRLRRGWRASQRPAMRSVNA
ncbi:MAG: WhiB family transcriptional regulator [Acidimicrobiales bacterium]